MLAAPEPVRFDLALTSRDRVILARARAALGGSRDDFRESLRALEHAVRTTIDAGRIYLLDGSPRPLIGSIVSGVGISEGASCTLVERIDRGRRVVLGALR